MLQDYWVIEAEYSKKDTFYFIYLTAESLKQQVYNAMPLYIDGEFSSFYIITDDTFIELFKDALCIYNKEDNAEPFNNYSHKLNKLFNENRLTYLTNVYSICKVSRAYLEGVEYANKLYTVKELEQFAIVISVVVYMYITSPQDSYPSLLAQRDIYSNIKFKEFEVTLSVLNEMWLNDISLRDENNISVGINQSIFLPLVPYRIQLEEYVNFFHSLGNSSYIGLKETLLLNDGYTNVSTDPLKNLYQFTRQTNVNTGLIHIDSYTLYSYYDKGVIRYLFTIRINHKTYYLYDKAALYCYSIDKLRVRGGFSIIDVVITEDDYINDLIQRNIIRSTDTDIIKYCNLLKEAYVSGR